MPTLLHPGTKQRVLFVHIPRTAGRFINENLLLNGIISEQDDIYGEIDGVQIDHFHQDLYEKHLNVQNIPHFGVFRDPVERFYSASSFLLHEYGKKVEKDLKSYKKFTKLINTLISTHSNNWFRPQHEFFSSHTHKWKFENGFEEPFFNWLSDIFNTEIIKKQNSFEPNYWDGKKIEKEAIITNNIKKFYKKDYE
jgi:hypothetical protein